MEKHFDTIWDGFGKGIRTYFIAKTRDEDLANDLLQETFIKIYLNLGTVKDTERLGGWVHRIAHNVLTDHFRTKNLSVPVEGKDFEGQNEAITYNELLASLVKPFMKQLPEEYREAIYLSDIEGLSQKELAERLHISYSGAKSRVQRARKKLKEVFEECCNIVADKYGNVQDCVPRASYCKGC